MKYLLVLFCMSPFLAKAVQIVKYQSDSDGSSRQAFTLSNKKITYNKESNLFDKNADYSLGVFEMSNVSNLDINTKIETVLNRVRSADQALEARGLSFNELSKSGDHHQEFILLDSFKILKNSAFYEELDQAFSDLLSKKYVHVKGVRLSKDFKKIHYFQNSKPLKVEDFNIKFSCKSETPPTVCRIKDEGFLFIK